MNWGTVPEWVMAALAAATAGLAWATWRSSKRIEWFTGAMESHSTMDIRLQAKRDGIRVEAYDPALTNPRRVPHPGEEWSLDVIYLALPPGLRADHRGRRG
jgi:hypothetical protein